MHSRTGLFVLAAALLVGTPALSQPAEIQVGFSTKKITPVGPSPAGWGFTMNPNTLVWGEEYVDVDGDDCYDPGEPHVDDPRNSLIDAQSTGKWDGISTNAGFGGKCALGMLDDTWARTVVFTKGGRTVAMTSLDVVGWFQEEIDRIREELATQHPHVQLDGMIVAATHTHEGADTMGLWHGSAGYVLDGKYPLYQQFIRAQVVTSIVEAYEARETAWVKFANGNQPLGLRDSRGPTVFDPTVYSAQFVRPSDESTIGSLTNWSNHPEALGSNNNYISSDFAHGVRERLESQIGGTAVYFSGSVGGLQTPLSVTNIPGFPTDDKSYARNLKLGEIVADAAISALAGASYATNTDVSVAHKDFIIPFENASLTALNEAGIFDKDLSYDGGNGNAGVLTEMYAVTLGPAVFITVPGELFPEIANGGYGRSVPGSHEYCPEADTGRPYEPVIRDQFAGATYKFLFGLGQDELGYIVPKYDFWAFGFPPDTETYAPGTPVDELTNEPRPPIMIGVVEREDPCGVGHYEETVSAASAMAPLVACTAAELAGHDPFGNPTGQYEACTAENTESLPGGIVPPPTP